MIDFLSTVTSAAVWGYTKIEAKHQRSSYLFLFVSLQTSTGGSQSNGFPTQL